MNSLSLNSKGEEMVNFGFKVNDEVVSNRGEKGKIIEICECEECKKRGFYEPFVEWEDGEKTNISIYQLCNGFENFYKIGKIIFGNVVSDEQIDEEIDDNKSTIAICERNIKNLLSDKERLKKMRAEVKNNG